MIRSFLQQALIIVAQLYIKRYRPTIVAVTGSVGKTSTKEAIACALQGQYTLRVNGGNLNNELGVPLTIIGDWTERYYTQGGTLGFWLRVAAAGLWGLVIPQNYPRVLVLEYGADRPGDIGRLAHAFKPHIGVITAIGETPVHVEFFAGPQALADEKAELLHVLGSTDVAILNADDLTVLDMQKKTKARILTFGFAEHATMRISNIEVMANAANQPEGTVFKLHDARSFVPVKIYGSLGTSHAMAAAAAAAVADVFDIHLVSVSEALAAYRGPAGRLRILEGIKNSVIIDDTYNASPLAVHVALETLRDVPGKRKVAILGDMRELGRYTLQAHEEAGNRVAEIADLIVCVGEKGKFIADAAANQMPQEHIKTFETSDAAKIAVQELIREGDIILVKGSQGVRMERIVEELMAHPEQRRELLVRQSDTWLKKE